MDLQHTFSVPIGIDAAWVAFNDLEGIAPCFPGAVITSVDGDDFTGTAKVKLGPVALQYSGKGQWLSRDESAYRAVIEAVGKDKRGNGTASATITAHLESQGPAMTTVVVNTDLRITGRPAQFGRGVIQDVGSKILDQFAACLSERLGQEDAAGTSVGDGEAVAAATVAATAPESMEAEATEEDATEADATKADATKAEAVATQAEPMPAPALAAVAPASTVAAGPGVTAGDAAEDVPDVGATEADADPTSRSNGLQTFAPITMAPKSGGTTSLSAATPPRVVRPTSASPQVPAEPMELDLGGLVGPVLLKRYGPTAAACLVTAVITWFVARRLP